MTGIVIIDGVFNNVASVWHQEILWALSQGIGVFGAASMGALRAAELRSVGMRGVGIIAQAYCNGRFPGFSDPFDGDDEVAILHGPAELGWRQITIALADLRWSLYCEVRRGVLSAVAAQQTVNMLKPMCFAARTRETVQSVLAQTAPRAVSLVDALLQGQTLKQQDARKAFKFMQRKGGSVRLDDARFHETANWRAFRAQADGEEGRPAVDGTWDALAELRMQPATWRRVRRDAMSRLVALGAAPAPRNEIELRHAVMHFRRARGLHDRNTVRAWLSANDCEMHDLDRIAESEAAIALYERSGHWRIFEMMADLLKAENFYFSLKERRQAKNSFMQGRSQPSPLALDVALDWFMQNQIGCDSNDDYEEVAREFAFANLKDVSIEAWKELEFSSQNARRVSK